MKKEEEQDGDIQIRVNAVIRKLLRKEIIRQEDEEDNKYRRRIVK